MKYVVLLVLSLALLGAGFWMFGTATSDGITEQWRALVFFGGILSVTLAFALPIAIVPALRK